MFFQLFFSDNFSRRYLKFINVFFKRLKSLCKIDKKVSYIFSGGKDGTFFTISVGGPADDGKEVLFLMQKVLGLTTKKFQLCKA